MNVYYEKRLKKMSKENKKLNKRVVDYRNKKAKNINREL